MKELTLYIPKACDVFSGLPVCISKVKKGLPKCTRRWRMAMSHTQRKREQTSLHTHSYHPVKAKKPDKASQSIAVTGGQETTEANEQAAADGWHVHVAAMP